MTSRGSLLMLAALAACSSSGPAVGGEPTGPAPAVQVEPTASTEVAPRPGTIGRAWRRMNIDQLQASLERVSGGIGWTESDPSTGQPVDVLGALSGSLGKPDFLNSNDEDLQPALLFQKFLDDAASSVCRAWIEREQTQDAAARLLMLHADFGDSPDSAPAAIEANMRAALLRFHGRPVPAGAPALTPWLGLVRNVWQATGDMSAAWRTTCVALFTHPDFYSY